MNHRTTTIGKEMARVVKRRPAIGLGVTAMLACVSACGSMSTPRSSSPPPLPAGLSEAQIFDATQQSPAALLRQLYETHKVLVLAFVSHENAKQYRALDTLLDQVGDDPRLKYIVLERFHYDAPALETASLHDVKPTQLPSLFTGVSARQARASLCTSAEWAYTWSVVLPRIRTLNARRGAAHPLRVTSVDGVTWDDIAGHTRDSITAVRFHDIIWSALMRDTAAKAILVYHLAHTIRGFTGGWWGDTSVAHQATPTSFFNKFLHNHPEARSQTALVLVEGGGVDSPQASKTIVFQFTQRQVARHPDEPFGIRLAPFRRVADEHGMAVFNPSNTIHLVTGQSTATLPEMIDAVVWWPHSEQWKLKSAGEYLPGVCPGPTQQAGP